MSRTKLKGSQAPPLLGVVCLFVSLDLVPLVNTAADTQRHSESAKQQVNCQLTRGVSAAGTVAKPLADNGLAAALASTNASERMSATKAVFALGPDALDCLEEAGASYATTDRPRRIDVIYSTLAEDPPWALPGKTHIRLFLAPGVTTPRLAELARRHGLRLPVLEASRSLTSLWVEIDGNRGIKEVVAGILLNEEEVVTLGFAYLKRGID